MTIKWRVKLKPCPTCRKDDSLVPWERSPPFAVNPRGLLTHRVRYVTTYSRNGELSHYAVNYLCGNGTCFNPSTVNDVLVFDPPKDRMLCDFCESKAQRKRLPSGDKLAGRHVHRGQLGLEFPLLLIRFNDGRDACLL